MMDELFHMNPAQTDSVPFVSQQIIGALRSPEDEDFLFEAAMLDQQQVLDDGWRVCSSDPTRGGRGS